MNKETQMLVRICNIITILLMFVLCAVVLDMHNKIQQSKKEVAELQKREFVIHKPADIIIEDWRGKPGLPSRHRILRRGLPPLNGMGVK